MRKIFLANRVRGEETQLELRRLKRMMEIKEATMERLIEERSDLKNHLKKIPIWVDDHVTRLNWGREQFESLISDLETRIDQLECVVEIQSGQLSAYANRGTQGRNVTVTTAPQPKSGPSLNGWSTRFVPRRERTEPHFQQYTNKVSPRCTR